MLKFRLNWDINYVLRFGFEIDIEVRIILYFLEDKWKYLYLKVLLCSNYDEANQLIRIQFPNPSRVTCDHQT